jgi:hypothetical protein
MRSFLFIASILGLIFAGVYLFMEKDIHGAYKIPFIDGNEFKLGLNSSLPNNQLTSSSEWEDVLIGRWNFETIFRAEERNRKFAGEVIYRDDNTFTRFVTFKLFHKDLEEDILIAGGKVEGIWSVDTLNNTWIESVTECSMKVTYSFHLSDKDFNVCNSYFRSGREARYGQVDSDYSQVSIDAFNQDKIVITLKNYSSGAKDHFRFTKIAD